MGLSPAELSYVRGLVSAEAGIDVPPGKDYLIDARLTELARSERHPSCSSLVRDAQVGGSRSPMAQKVVEAMTTNETSFFRDSTVFEALRTTLIPSLLEGRRKGSTLNIWSAACSSGQEIYSTAMLLEELRARLDGYTVSLLATDLSPKMVARTRDARYSSLETNRGLRPEQLRDYFDPVGHDFQLRPALRARVTARTLNLTTPFPPLPKMDIIFIRNVLIYFPEPTRRLVLARMRRVIADDGYLFLGSSENTASATSDFVVKFLGGTAVYLPSKP